MRNVKGPGGFDVLFYDGVRGVQGPGGFNVLFYDGMRSVKGPGGFDGLFYDVRTVSRCLGGSTSYSMMA